jgi:lipid II isoglutaminyl synthase (glutamine-hydrolysing)
MSLTIATLFPLVTVAAGDEANATALVRRAAARGLDARAVTVSRPEEMVPADLYLVGGTGRSGTAALVELLERAGFADSVRRGRCSVFAVDAGMDALARSWTDPAGVPRSGLGLLGLSVLPGPAVTETVVTRPTDHLPAMVGWVSHDTRTVRDPGLPALAEVERGSAHLVLEPDGAVHDRILATRLHGPVLALNPELADLVLGRLAPDASASWGPLDSPDAQRARAERIAEIRATPIRARRWGRRG